MTLTIRRAKSSDLGGVNKLLYEIEDIHRIGRPDLFKLGAKKYSDEEVLTLFNDDSKPIFVATDDSDAVLGYAFCAFEVHQGELSIIDRKTLYLDDLCVDEAVRGRHVGKSLYEFVLNFAKEQGCYNVTLHAWECNPKAVEFYKKIGMTTMYTAFETIL